MGLAEGPQVADELLHLRAENAALRTQVRLQQGELRGATRELEAISYSMAHDLRAPLHAIDGFSGALEARYATSLDERGLHYVKRIRAGGAHMAQLVDGLLRLLQLGRVELEMQDIDLAAVAARALAELRASGAAGACDVAIDPALGRVLADSVLMRQLFLCLLGNACRFSNGSARPHAHVGVEQVAGESVWFVRDNGDGFDSAKAARLFQPFQTFHDAREDKGIGVGLALAQRIVERHGGRIWAHSRPGEGATFYFTLGRQARSLSA